MEIGATYRTSGSRPWPSAISDSQGARATLRPVAPPVWVDEQGRPLPTYPCPRPWCGREVAVRFRGFRLEHLKHVGWQARQPRQ